jgi:hypothetical protein
MDQTTITAIASGVGIAIGLAIHQMRQAKKNEALASRIGPVLRDRGPLTLPVLSEALGMGGFMARGQVALALNEMVTAGTLEVIPAPEGTPQLEKVKLIQYRLRA